MSPFVIRLRRTLALAVFALAVSAPSLPAGALDSSAGRLEIAPVVEGLEIPWAFGFLPGGEILITERAGRLWLVRADGTRREIGGLPQVAFVGQGGLLDLLVPRDFARSREIFLTIARPQGLGAGTALVRARLPEGATRLEAATVIFEMRPGTRGGQHFGSRVVEAGDGLLYVTIGDRGRAPQAQDLGIEAGSVVRVTRQGGIPADNPFVGRDGAAPAIWSYGHRNPQGAAVDGRGRVWVVEHGAMGGDEVNRVRRGANFGWPVIAYGRNYNGSAIGVGTARAGMEQPDFYWDPSIAPSGMAFLDSALLPQWRGDLFIGSLKFDFISRLEVSPSGLREVERLKAPETERVRDVRQGPDGALWFLSEPRGTLYRIAPAG